MPRSAELFAILLRAEGTWISVSDLALELYGDSGWYERNAIVSLMYRVRRLHPDRHIESSRRIGYRLIPRSAS